MDAIILVKAGEVIKKIPWNKIKEHAPEIVVIAKKIYDKLKNPKDGLSLDQRVERIEEIEKDQQEYIAQLADFVTKNSDYTLRLSMRINILFCNFNSCSCFFDFKLND